jgi:hypothetical protein
MTTQASVQRPSLAEPVIIAEFWANRRGEAIRVQLSEFKGRALLDVRKYYTAKDGTMQPTKKGFAIAVARLPELASGIGKALGKAQELGLIADNGRGHD